MFDRQDEVEDSDDDEEQGILQEGVQMGEHQ